MTPLKGQLLPATNRPDCLFSLERSVPTPARRSAALIVVLALVAGACASESGDSSPDADGAEQPAGSPQVNAPSEVENGDPPEPASGEPSSTAQMPGPQPSDVGPEASPTDSPGPETLGPVDACTRANRLGTFRLYQSIDKTLLTGSVLDRTNPRADFEVLNQAGGCELLGPRTLTCDTACESGQSCAGDNVCIPSPEKVSVGALTLSGLAAPWEVRPNGITKDYSASLAEPFPAYIAGDEIELSAAGDTISAFDLRATAVETLMSEQSTVAVARGSAASLTWLPSAQGEGDVLISFTVNAHGATTGWIECIVPDTGAFDVPEALVTELIDLGLSGFPRATIERRSLSATLVDGGCVDFKVASDLTLELEVEGLVSCKIDDDCPEGQTCSPEFACGEPE